MSGLPCGLRPVRQLYPIKRLQTNKRLFLEHDDATEELPGSPVGAVLRCRLAIGGMLDADAGLDAAQEAGGGVPVRVPALLHKIELGDEVWVRGEAGDGEDFAEVARFCAGMYR
jgi:hypothetical protein